MFYVETTALQIGAHSFCAICQQHCALQALQYSFDYVLSANKIVESGN